MNFNLTEDQVSFQSLARDFAKKELQSQAREWDEKKIFPIDVIKKSAEMGFCGLYLQRGCRRHGPFPFRYSYYI